MASYAPRTPTTIEDWTRSDEYHNSFLIPRDEGLEFALSNSHEQGLPGIAVSVAQGKYLNLVAKSISAKRVLEVGTLGGYSTIWLARALPADGSITTLELDPHHSKVAAENFAKAGVADKITIITGAAADSLVTINPEVPFDLVFIDADKPSNPIYFREAKRLVRKGGIIIVDNVVRHGRVADPSFTDNNVEGVRNLLRLIQGDEEIEATTIATVGEKGYDGFIYALKK